MGLWELGELRLVVCRDSGLLGGTLGSCSSFMVNVESPCAFLFLSSLLQVFTKYGKCYMFNSGEDGKPLLTTVKGGTGNGLEIMLDIQQDEYLPVWGETGMSVCLRAPSLGPPGPRLN